MSDKILMSKRISHNEGESPHLTLDFWVNVTTDADAVGRQIAEYIKKVQELV